MRSRDRIATITDLFVQPPDTRCLERDGYQVVRTESMPSYNMGNYLILDQAPDASTNTGASNSIDTWLARCWQELGDMPIRKRMLLWETPAGTTWPQDNAEDDAEDDAEQDAGDDQGQDQEPPGEYQALIVLALEQPPAQPPRTLEGIAFRPVTGDREWRLVPELSVATLDKEIPGYVEFVTWRYDQYRRSLASNAGHVWGAWLGDTLVASLGLFSAPEALRFQEVQTHPEHRGRGICTAMCTHALRHHMAAEPGKPAIIVAEAGSQAERIYRRIGFAEIGRQHALEHGVPDTAGNDGNTGNTESL